MNENEKLLVEAIGTMLHQKAALGLSDHMDQIEKLNSVERGVEHLHGQIDDMFRLKAADSNFYESACQAFNKVHCYKYIDDPTFTEAMDRELVCQGIPANDRREITGFIPEIIESLKKSNADWAERDFGFNPNLDEIREVSKPKLYED